MQLSQAYRNKIYAGVLGKMIGVYLGRPVEGWPYQTIIDRFGEIPYYVNNELDLPLIVADDDLSGTFAFFPAVEDNGFPTEVTAEQIGKTWLNYIIEDRSILWWGGMGNSTEHTAYLNLKRGIPAPESGSIRRNGPVLAQQIGAQIFMDAYAMMCPGDPEKANRLVRACAGVSHDGVALDAAGFLGALEAAAFDERDLNKLFDSCMAYVETDQLRSLVDDVRNICAAHSDWRKVREVLDSRYGYHLYPGPCHMIPNHAMVLSAILCAGDDFAQSVKIGASAAWDTDCNAGNVGCFNGIRLGLEGLETGPDFRGPVADRLLVITSDGGEGITDAVKETRRIVRAAERTGGLEETPQPPRFAFEYPGSVQGFMPCPYEPFPKAEFTLGNGNMEGAGDGLRVRFAALAEGANASVSVATFLDLHEEYRNYETYVSPTLYGGQTVVLKADCPCERGPAMRPYVWYTDRDNNLKKEAGPWEQLGPVTREIRWTVPDLGGLPVLRFGVEFSSVKRYTGDVFLRSADWSNTPVRLEQKGIMMKDMWDLNPFWAKMFVSSAKNFAPNLNCTYCISHNEENGVATVGTRDFADYTVSSRLKFSLHRQGGLVVRSQGHRRYYAAVLTGGDTLRIIKRMDEREIVLAEAPFAYEQFVPCALSLRAEGSRLTARAGDVELTAVDEEQPYLRGAAGYLVDSGAMFIDGFLLEGV